MKKNVVNTSKVKLRVGDIVILDVKNKEERKKGKVLSVLRKENKVLVEGINVRTRHVKPRRQGEESGIIKREAPVNVSKVSYYCPKCERGTKLGIKIVDGKRIRFCRKCKEEIK